MFKKLIASLSVMAFIAAANAAAIVSIVPVDNSDAVSFTDFAVDVPTWAAAGYLTYDLVIDTQGEHWTTAYCFASLTGATFWNHPNANSSEMAPDPANFPFFGLTRCDSFYTAYNAYPTLGGDTASPPAPAPGSPIQNSPTVREMEWYDVPPLDNVGVFTIARFTFLPTSPNWTFWVTGTTTTIEDPVASPFYPPEPTGLALLAVGSLVAIRRR